MVGKFEYQKKCDEETCRGARNYTFLQFSLGGGGGGETQLLFVDNSKTQSSNNLGIT